MLKRTKKDKHVTDKKLLNTIQSTLYALDILYIGHFFCVWFGLTEKLGEKLSIHWIFLFIDWTFFLLDWEKSEVLHLIFLVSFAFFAFFLDKSNKENNTEGEF